ILLEKHALSQINQQEIENNLHLAYFYIHELEKSFKYGEKAVEADLAFHRLLVEMSKNQTLTLLWESISGLIGTLIEVSSSSSELKQEKIIFEHKRILKFLEKYDIEQAQKYLEKHIKDIQNIIFKSYNEK